MDLVRRHLHCARQMRANHPILFVGVLLLLTSIFHAAPQSAPSAQGKSIKETLRRQKALRMEMIPPYAVWLRFEVPDIITSEEVSVFKRLRTDDEREEFIQQFWERHNPEPGSLENRFKENYYRRRVRANEAFSTTTPGWKSDRGRIYIRFGPPDAIEESPHGGMMRWSEALNGGVTVTKPFERWLYRDMAGIGPNQVLIFLNSTSTGDYRLVMLPSDENRVLHDPRHDREMPQGPIVPPEPFLKPSHPPAPAKFPDLRALVNTGTISTNSIPVLVQTYAFSATDETDLALVAVQIPTHDLQFHTEDGVMQARVDVYGQLQSLPGSIVNAFEKTFVVDLPKGDSKEAENGKFVFGEFVRLRPARYHLKLAIKDEANGRTGMVTAGPIVPSFGEFRLTATPLILADSLERYIPPASELDPFVIGNSKVLPNPGQVFMRDNTLGVYLQVYGLGLDPDTRKPNFRVDYEILEDGKPVFEVAEDAAHMAEASTEFTIARNIPLKDLQPGTYTLQINIADILGKQTLTPSTIFVLR